MAKQKNIKMILFMLNTHTVNEKKAKMEEQNNVCYHITNAFQSESTLYSVKERIARNRHHIWSLSDWNGTWTHNHLVRRQTLNGWLFDYELGGYGFEPRCNHLVQWLIARILIFT